MGILATFSSASCGDCVYEGLSCWGGEVWGGRGVVIDHRSILPSFYSGCNFNR